MVRPQPMFLVSNPHILIYHLLYHLFFFNILFKIFISISYFIYSCGSFKMLLAESLMKEDKNANPDLNDFDVIMIYQSVILSVFLC